MLNPQLERALEERRAQSSISEQVKWILKRLLAGSRPEISAVARELGVSDRTLQRRIIDDGATFRQLLIEARQELAHEYSQTAGDGCHGSGISARLRGFEFFLSSLPNVGRDDTRPVEGGAPRICRPRPLKRDKCQGTWS